VEKKRVARPKFVWDFAPIGVMFWATTWAALPWTCLWSYRTLSDRGGRVCNRNSCGFRHRALLKALLTGTVGKMHPQLFTAENEEDNDDDAIDSNENDNENANDSDPSDDLDTYVAETFLYIEEEEFGKTQNQFRSSF